MFTRRKLLSLLTLIPLFPRVTFSKVNNPTSIKKFGVRGDGLNDDSENFKKALSSGIKSLFIPSGKYIINETILVKFNNSIEIICDKNVFFVLGDGVKKGLFVFLGSKNIDLVWKGGDIDGNFINQGPEVLQSNGRLLDLSHGLVTNFWRSVLLEDIYIHDFMGHHINHAGNSFFTARNIKIKSHVSKVLPEGGARGDGITGASEIINIDNVSGYSSDDLIAVFSGISWLPYAKDLNTTSVKHVSISNVKSIPYELDNNTYNTWNAVSISASNNSSIRSVSIENINGTFRNRGVGIVSEVFSGNTVGSIDLIKIRNVNLSVIGSKENIYSHPAILIGDFRYVNKSVSYTSLSSFKKIYLTGINVKVTNGMPSVISLASIKSELVNMDKISIKGFEGWGGVPVFIYGSIDIPVLNIHAPTINKEGMPFLKLAINNDKSLQIKCTSSQDVRKFIRFDNHYHNNFTMVGTK